MHFSFAHNACPRKVTIDLNHAAFVHGETHSDILGCRQLIIMWFSCTVYSKEEWCFICLLLHAAVCLFGKHSRIQFVSCKWVIMDHDG